MNQDVFKLDKEMEEILDKLRSIQEDSKKLILDTIIEVQRKPIEEVYSESKEE